MKKILVADDDKFLANAYRVKFTKAGFDVKVARDGEEAFEILKTFMPDLMVLDLVMPVKDGFTTLEELKSNDSYKKIPVIVASNLGQKEDTEKALKLGAIDCIVKSDLSLDSLIKKINHIVGA